MRFRAAGPRAVLVDVPDAQHAVALAQWARHCGMEAEEVVPAAATVLFDGVDPSAVAARLAEANGAWSVGLPEADDRVVEVPTVYDGADLGEVARWWGCSVDEVIRRHTATEFTSLFCGFAPGFAYLGGLPSAWAVSRRAEPRPSVPAGSVGLAGAWCGVYPSASPGGWQLLGRTALTLWDLAADPPAMLAPGTRVRFVAVR